MLSRQALQLGVRDEEMGIMGVMGRMGFIRREFWARHEMQFGAETKWLGELLWKATSGNGVR